MRIDGSFSPRVPSPSRSAGLKHGDRWSKRLCALRDRMTYFRCVDRRPHSHVIVHIRSRSAISGPYTAGAFSERSKWTTASGSAGKTNHLCQ
ncbi:hypothetical protein BaRGS_00018024 [Batillaria attramentaria]|uniref:Uncharacterized protein n=1 Tax=Batillaria attramentaria TaxID=370345 RepID=A0ABD0KVI6_9CAEN